MSVRGPRRRRNHVGGLGVADVLLLVIVADASQNAMSGGYRPFSEGFVLIGAIIGWIWLLDWLSFRYRWVRRFAQAQRLLIDAGKPHKENLGRQHITLEDLATKLREQGIEQFADVKKAYLEGDGEMSVIRYASPLPTQRKHSRQRPPNG